MTTKERKSLFLALLEKNAGNVSITCKKVGIDRKTFYNWKEQDKKFADAFEEIEEGLIDFTESKMMQGISEGNTALICFHLKTKGKKRGYIEKSEIEHSGEIVVELPQLFKDMFKKGA